jgi:PPK2 family polyphosphate:nucleotide phosphotransferase
MKLKDISTKPPDRESKEETEEQFNNLKDTFSELQNRFYAWGEKSLLIILQGMDASGKDGTVKDVFCGINPAGIRVTSYKMPTEEELKHDFLWRIHKNMPEKGLIGVFNRSHYEDLILPIVHGEKAEVTESRIQSINSFEKHLTDNDTVILKFYLHVSEEAQRERIKDREKNPEKMWKYDPNDIKVVNTREKFIRAYDIALNQCSEPVPWHVIPADKNRYRNLLILKQIVHTLEKMNPQYPVLR